MRVRCGKPCIIDKEPVYSAIASHFHERFPKQYTVDTRFNGTVRVCRLWLIPCDCPSAKVLALRALLLRLHQRRYH